MEQMLSHQFFTEFATNFQKTQTTEIAEALRKAALMDVNCKESILTAVHKTEQRLKDEKKLVSLILKK